MVPSLTIYSRSIFGENALANLSIEKPMDDKDAKVTGHIRIRAKSQVGFFSATQSLARHCPQSANLELFSELFIFQGMALSLGDKISSSQKQSVQAA